MNESIANFVTRGVLESFVRFLERQRKQIEDGGAVVLINKLGTLFGKAILIPPAILAIVMMKMLEPFVRVRLGKLDISRIGGAYSADFYLSERWLGIHDRRNFDIFYFGTVKKTICNQQWLKMWKRVLRVFPFWRFAGMVDNMQRKSFKDGSHSIPLIRAGDLPSESLKKNASALQRVLECKKPHLSFTREEEMAGQQALRNMGIPNGNPFVCFHSRDSAYLNAVYPSTDWSYHNYRNSSIYNYLEAMEQLTRQGYYAIRMGSVVSEKLSTANAAVIDYASNGARSEFLDIFLGAKCEFFVCSDTGISSIPEIFRRPAVYANWTAIKRISPWVLNSLFIMKKFYLPGEERFLKFRELMDLSVGDVQTQDRFSERGVALIENTSDEILDVVKEMEQRLKGQWKTTVEDEKLQQEFWALFGPHKLKSPGVRMGAEFLRKNQHLL